MSRVWYEHNASGYKTYVRPTTAEISSLPAGWEERQNLQGRIYYFHVSTGKSSWAKPGRTLPTGWKETKTPDGRSFYVHEEYQLSTWDWPGQQPCQDRSLQVSQQPSQRRVVATGGKTEQRNVVSQRASAVMSGIGIAGKLSTSAADMASDPITGTTKAVTKGVMYAAKSLRNNKKARKMLSRVGMKGMKQITEAAINIGGDGDDIDVGDDDEAEVDGNDEDDGDNCRSDAVDEAFENGSHDCNTNTTDTEVSGYPQQDVPSNPGCVDSQAQTMDTDHFMRQGSSIDSCGQVSNTPDYDENVPPPTVNNVAFVENNETGNNLTEPSVVGQVPNQSTHNDVGEGIDNQNSTQTTWTWVEQGVNSESIDPTARSYVDLNNSDQSEKSFQNCVADSEYAINPAAEQNEVVSTGTTNVENNVWDHNANSQDTSMLIPPPTSALSVASAGYAPSQSVANPLSSNNLPSDVGQAGDANQRPPAPFVFEPMLAAPMMAEPPASSDGVIFAQQYPPAYDSSSALELV
jgi:WW domain